MPRALRKGALPSKTCQDLWVVMRWHAKGFPMTHARAAVHIHLASNLCRETQAELHHACPPHLFSSPRCCARRARSFCESVSVNAPATCPPGGGLDPAVATSRLVRPPTPLQSQLAWRGAVCTENTCFACQGIEPMARHNLHGKGQLWSRCKTESMPSQSLPPAASATSVSQ